METSGVYLRRLGHDASSCRINFGAFDGDGAQRPSLLDRCFDIDEALGLGFSCGFKISYGSTTAGNDHQGLLGRDGMG